MCSDRAESLGRTSLFWNLSEETEVCMSVFMTKLNT